MPWDVISFNQEKMHCKLFPGLSVKKPNLKYYSHLVFICKADGMMLALWDNPLCIDFLGFIHFLAVESKCTVTPQLVSQ